MSKVNYFKNLKSVIPDERPHDVEYYLERIQSGKHQKIIKNLRAEINPDKKKELKNSLPGVTFCGTFNVRKKDALKQGSGLAILDFDKLEDVFGLKETLKSNNLIMAVWISPSGNGLKALVKIPVIENDNEYKHIFKQLKELFPLIDVSGSDISRLCFESYDPDIYINLDSDMFIPTVLEKTFELNDIGVLTNLPLIDGNEIANFLIKWFKGKFDSSNRNSSLFKLAIAFNDFGVQRSICSNYLLSYTQKDFNEKEIEALINSAYKNTSNFGTKHFEDKKKKKVIENLVFGGRKEKEILEKFIELSKVFDDELKDL
jgi:hypothetical protein